MIEPEIQRIIGERYRVVRRIGQGGLGTVVEAMDARLRRAVALKVVAPRSDGSMRERAIQEAQERQTRRCTRQMGGWWGRRHTCRPRRWPPNWLSSSTNRLENDRISARGLVHQLVRNEDTNLPDFFELLGLEPVSMRATIEKIRTENYEFSRFDKSVATLELLGAVANRDGRCVIRNRIYERAIAQRLASGHSADSPETPTQTARETLVNVDMVGYSEVARYLEYVLSVDAVGLLGESIQAQIVAGLHGCGLDESVVHGFTGDGAILRFSEARLAHDFAVRFLAVVDERNRQIPDPGLRRHYRMGAATGDIVSWGKQGSDERAGLVFTRSQRLESNGAPGHFLIDVTTFRGLTEEQASLYGEVEQIEVKHGVTVTAHRFVHRSPEPG